MYSQNLEEAYISEYFGDFIGTLLSVGENDGRTLSNSLALIEKGWTAHLVEPSPKAYRRLEFLHMGNTRVKTYPYAISNTPGWTKLYESGAHINKNDVALLSTLDEEELSRWPGLEFNEVQVQCMTIKSLFYGMNFDFITIDAEGKDVEILEQIDLTNTKLICVEWNSIPSRLDEIIGYCEGFGLNKIIHKNGENVLCAR